MNHQRKLSGKRKSKTWVSDGSIVDHKEIRSNRPWYRSPHRLIEKAKKLANERLR